MERNQQEMGGRDTETLFLRWIVELNIDYCWGRKFLIFIHVYVFTQINAIKLREDAGVTARCASLCPVLADAGSER